MSRASGAAGNAGHQAGDTWQARLGQARRCAAAVGRLGLGASGCSATWRWKASGWRLRPRSLPRSAERDKLVAQGGEVAAVKARELARLGAIAKESSFVFAAELFGWRTFANRRELAGSVGLTGTPYSSGDSAREQGISKAGNRRMRTMLVADCLVLAQIPADERTGALVAGALRRQRGADAQNCHRGAGAQAAGALWRYLERGVVPGRGAQDEGLGIDARRGQTARHRHAADSPACTVLDLVKAKPCRRPCGPALTRSARGAARALWSGRKKARGAGRTKEVTDDRKGGRQRARQRGACRPAGKDPARNLGRPARAAAVSVDGAS